jgi:hypothetical protein
MTPNPLEVCNANHHHNARLLKNGNVLLLSNQRSTLGGAFPGLHRGTKARNARTRNLENCLDLYLGAPLRVPASIHVAQFDSITFRMEGQPHPITVGGQHHTLNPEPVLVLNHHQHSRSPSI